MEERIEKHLYYLSIALSVSKRSSCLRRHYGSIIVNHDRIVSTGYNGAPRGCVNCTDLGFCSRIKNNIAHNSDYTDCIAVHSEQNAIIHANYLEMQDATLYLAGEDIETGELIENIDCCPLCKQMIINSGIKQVILMQDLKNYKTIQTYDWISEINEKRVQSR